MTQCEKIIAALRASGSQGITSRDMIGMNIFKYSSRIAELRRRGWVIKAHRVRGNLYRYTLKSRPSQSALQAPVFIVHPVQSRLIEVEQKPRHRWF